MISLKVVAWNITTSISDHLTQYLIIRDQTTNFEANREKEFQNIRKFNKDSFLADLCKINWDTIYKNINKYKNDSDLFFELFLRKINFLYNKHSPPVTSKRKIKRNPSKPWLTSGIIKSITVKNKLYKQFCQATNPVQRVNLHQKFKTNRNQIVTLNRLSKENYFKKYGTV